MSNPNYPTQSQNDARYSKPTDVTAAISAQATTDAGQYDLIYKPEKYGAVGDGTTDDTTALNAAHTAADSTGGIVVYGAKTYLVSGTIVAGHGKQVRIRGVAGKTIIKSTSATADILVIGNGTSPSGGWIGGYCDGIMVQGPTATPAQNNQAGIKLNAMVQFSFRQCEARNTDIGFDLIGNNAGSCYFDCHAGSFTACNVGMLLRTGNTSGNQIYLYNCWFEGKYAALWMEPGFDGLGWYGGQALSARGATGNQDAYGAIQWGNQYASQGTLGDVGNWSLHDVDFEQAGAWLFRGYAQANGLAQSCDFLGNGSTASIGIMKLTNTAQSQISIQNSYVANAFSAAAPISIAGDYGSFLISETHTRFNNNATFNSVTPTTSSALLHSGVNKGIVHAGTVGSESSSVWIDGQRVRASVPATIKTANYTLVAADAGTIIEVNSASAITITVPQYTMTTGDVIDVFQYGTGQVTIAAGTGMTLRTSSSLTTRAQYSSASIRMRSATEAVVVGDLT